MKQTFKNLAELELDSNSEAQIERDLCRTFPRHPYFEQTYEGPLKKTIIQSKGVRSLKRVLTAFANYERQVDYV